MQLSKDNEVVGRDHWKILPSSTSSDDNSEERTLRALQQEAEQLNQILRDLHQADMNPTINTLINDGDNSSDTSDDDEKLSGSVDALRSQLNSITLASNTKAEEVGANRAQSQESISKSVAKLWKTYIGRKLETLPHDGGSALQVDPSIPQVRSFGSANTFESVEDLENQVRVTPEFMLVKIEDEKEEQEVVYFEGESEEKDNNSESGSECTDSFSKSEASPNHLILDTTIPLSDDPSDISGINPEYVDGKGAVFFDSSHPIASKNPRRIYLRLAFVLAIIAAAVLILVIVLSGGGKEKSSGVNQLNSASNPASSSSPTFEPTGNLVTSPTLPTPAPSVGGIASEEVDEDPTETAFPSEKPVSSSPTQSPTAGPTIEPSSRTTNAPSSFPTTSSPSVSPTLIPTREWLGQEGEWEMDNEGDVEWVDEEDVQAQNGGPPSAAPSTDPSITL